MRRKSVLFAALLILAAVVVVLGSRLFAGGPAQDVQTRGSGDSPRTSSRPAEVQLGQNASLGGRRPFPDDNPWNVDISHEPVDPNSDAYISSIGATARLHPDFGFIWQGALCGIPYVVVPGDQPTVPVQFRYASESDRGPYPIPADPPTDPEERHILMIDRDNWKLYELIGAQKKDDVWHAAAGAVFDLSSNDLRPAGWTSTDAAGLPVFPGLVRYDEVMEQKEIRHALRFTTTRTRRAYVHPARHFASRATDPALPPMGLRVRLKASYDISSFPASAQVILTALKKYGMMLADNGGNWFLSGTADSRWPSKEIDTLKRVKGSDFEVISVGNVVTR
jgi:hypothetical protein